MRNHANPYLKKKIPTPYLNHGTASCTAQVFNHYFLTGWPITLRAQLPGEPFLPAPPLALQFRAFSAFDFTFYFP